MGENIGFHISSMSEYISICITMSVKGKQTTPLNSLCLKMCFIIASCEQPVAIVLQLYSIMV